jgi:tRNA 5-methylaminomethyl-2-thiouridine biosynthesis bifunctional protein
MQRLEAGDDGWTAFDADGVPIACAPVAILANGVGIRALPQATTLPVSSARGQVTHLPAAAGSAPNVVVCRLGYVSPAIDGMRCAGATFAVDDDEPALRAADHRENLAKLDFILPGYGAQLEGPPMSGRVGFRPASPDRLPMVGALPAVTSIDRATPLADIPRQAGLYALSGFGARGLVWASLVAELLASQLAGEPLPLERDLVDALDPARYLLRPARRLLDEG